MKRKKLILNISFALILIATVCIFLWEVRKELATPSQDDIFGHTGTVFVMGVILVSFVVMQWELYRSLKYFLAYEARTKAENVSNALAAGLCGIFLVISTTTYSFFPNRAVQWFYYTLWTTGVLICNRLATGIYIERNTPWDDNKWCNLWRIVKNVLRYVILIPLGFGCFIELVNLLSMLGS